ncbi:hypothetical protein FGO68_gene8734 [Halteria grandinella]|uniref:Uncharacterized protein n=1 Tax=Halteria grandinella TaxID=5974 RepID=A0A8J8T081_HALGN|nr:hypothetical protein FGO68_gene8734 [Halteria grandinella]
MESSSLQHCLKHSSSHSVDDRQKPDIFTTCSDSNTSNLPQAPLSPLGDYEHLPSLTDIELDELPVQVPNPLPDDQEHAAAHIPQAAGLALPDPTTSSHNSQALKCLFKYVSFSFPGSIHTSQTLPQNFSGSNLAIQVESQGESSSISCIPSRSSSQDQSDQGELETAALLNHFAQDEESIAKDSSAEKSEEAAVPVGAIQQPPGDDSASAQVPGLNGEQKSSKLLQLSPASGSDEEEKAAPAKNETIIESDDDQGDEEVQSFILKFNMLTKKKQQLVRLSQAHLKMR